MKHYQKVLDTLHESRKEAEVERHTKDINSKERRALDREVFFLMEAKRVLESLREKYTKRWKKNGG